MPDAGVAPATDGAHACPNCGYVYEQRNGCAHEGVAPGTPWASLPDDWPCPVCAVRDKLDFKPVAVAA
jgi:alkane 1-monooxygenase